MANFKLFLGNRRPSNLIVGNKISCATSSGWQQDVESETISYASGSGWMQQEAPTGFSGYWLPHKEVWTKQPRTIPTISEEYIKSPYWLYLPSVHPTNTFIKGNALLPLTNIYSGTINKTVTRNVGLATLANTSLLNAVTLGWGSTESRTIIALFKGGDDTTRQVAGCTYGAIGPNCIIRHSNSTIDAKVITSAYEYAYPTLSIPTSTSDLIAVALSVNWKKGTTSIVSGGMFNTATFSPNSIGNYFAVLIGGGNGFTGYVGDIHLVFSCLQEIPIEKLLTLTRTSESVWQLFKKERRIWVSNPPPTRPLGRFWL